MSERALLHNSVIMEQNVIHEARFIDLRPLNKLFIQSIQTDFDYFEDSFKRTLAQQHNIPRLVKAKISPRAHLLLAWHNAQPVGYCIVRTSPDITYLHWMYVTDEVRGQGFGVGLLQKAIEISRIGRAKRLQLVTHDKQDFYHKYGFVDKVRIPGLQGGVDMTIMELDHGA